jgi:hypothetical protein
MRNMLPRIFRISKPLFLILISISPFLLHLVIVEASPQTVVSVEPQDSSANIGGTFAVNITVADVENLYGLEVTLSWNSSVLTVANIDDRIGHADGVLNNVVYVVQNSSQENSYSIAATSTNPAPPFNGTGNIARITFTVLNTGDSNLEIEAQLTDYPPPNRDPRVSLPIAHATINGFFHSMLPEFSGSTILTILMTLTLLTAIFYTRERKKSRRVFASDSASV